MKKTLLIVTVALLAFAPLTASASEHEHMGHMGMVRPYVGGWYRPWGGVWGGAWAGPWAGTYWGPYWSTPMPVTGEVKLDTKVKDAEVFVNAGYVGTTKDNRTLHLAPGRYTIEIREANRTAFSQRVYVQAGKTVHLHPEL